MKFLRLPDWLPTEAYGTEFTAAVDAVRAAARLCLRVQPGRGVIKEDRSPVTVADFGSQAVVCQILRERLPADVVMAEEEVSELRRRPELLEDVVNHVRSVHAHVQPESVLEWIAVGAHRPSAGRYWVLDPVDGTKGFLAGRSYAVALALVVDGSVVVGALACPDNKDPDGGRIIAAVKGRGAVIGGVYGTGPMTQVRVSGLEDPREAVICESFESAHSVRGVSQHVARWLGTVGNVLQMDSQAKYGAVASGKAEIYLRLPAKAGYLEWVWDHAAGMLIVQEAGGTVTDFDGRELDFAHGDKLIRNRGVVATNGRLHAVVMAAIKR